MTYGAVPWENCQSLQGCTEALTVNDDIAYVKIFEMIAPLRDLL